MLLLILACAEAPNGGDNSEDITCVVAVDDCLGGTCSACGPDDGSEAWFECDDGYRLDIVGDSLDETDELLCHCNPGSPYACG